MGHFLGATLVVLICCICIVCLVVWIGDKLNRWADRRWP